MNQADGNIDTGSSHEDTNMSRDQSSLPVSHKNNKPFSKAITPLVKHKKAASSRGNSQTSLPATEEFLLSDSQTGGVSNGIRAGYNETHHSLLESSFTNQNALEKSRNDGCVLGSTDSQSTAQFCGDLNDHDLASNNETSLTGHDITHFNGKNESSEATNGSSTSLGRSFSSGFEPSVSATPVLGTRTTHSPPASPIHQQQSHNIISNTIVYEGFPNSNGSSLPVKTGKLKFSEIPRRSKLTLMVMAVGNFGAGCTFSLPSPFFPREAEVKGASPTMVGLVFSSYELINFLMFPVFGTYLTVIGPKFMFASGLAVAGFCSLLFG
ncbi:MFS-type transporter slc18b1-like [Plakobranchus ocellatus]|uniref:MFS-type transporter slc18b1-like n=1 Tax=Plakobranchus ocellatus TaxID=259542 RepID=A0AAV4D2V3_9GAST|nr:MFS-type transporter slc18b1-like [Plakobranchus ocellatus]